MTYNPITSFRRPVTAVQMTRHRDAHAPSPEAGVDKWQVLRDLTTARRAFGLGDRALTVLQALLSFYPGSMLEGGDLIVFPSNRAICERLNGMACSTMRRHLAALLDSGLILRRDSPNGKRFVRRYRAGCEAFGFDLAPLLHRHHEIHRAAAAETAVREALESRRRQVSLMRRDLAALTEFGTRTAPMAANWTELDDHARLAARELRRRNDLKDLDRIASDLKTALEFAVAALDAETENLSINASEDEQHHQKSEKDNFDSNNFRNKDENPERVTLQKEDQNVAAGEVASVPLSYVLSICSELQTFMPERIHDWPGFLRSVELIRPMIGITNSAWNECVASMGHTAASVTVAAMLERHSKIRSPGAYLRHLARKAATGHFSPVAMLATLTRICDANDTGQPLNTVAMQ